MGLRYERVLAKALPMAKHGQWFEFEDKYGRGFCQVDLMLEMPRGILILEAKYTWVPEGHCQIEGLYSPVVEMALGKPCKGMVVCKKLIPGMPRELEIVSDLESGARALASGNRVVLHWLGNCQLLVDYNKLSKAA